MTWVWIVIAVVVVLAVVGLLVMAANKKKQEQRRTQAEELRTDAHAQSASVLDADRQARDAEAQAARARAEAARAEQQAAEAGRARDMERATHEDQIRQADRIDPDVDHRSDDYVPDAEPQRFDTQTGQPLEPNAERGTTGFEQPQGQHAATREPVARPGHGHDARDAARDRTHARDRGPAAAGGHPDPLASPGVSQVPAATRALRVLRYLASQPDPVPLEAIMRACELPRSTAYHLINAMIDEGFVAHLAEEHRFGLGVAAFEVGSGFSRQEPLQRIARRLLAELVDRTEHSAHLAVLHGRDVLYVVEERAPGRPPLVTDVGVRLPAHLTASGRAILAALPPPQVRALYPDRSAFVDRHGRGPATLSSLRTLLAETRQRGYATEDGEVTPGFASVAAAVLDHNGYPVAGIAITHPSDLEPAGLPDAVRRTALALTHRLSGRE